jgi:hypothetical protein
MCLIWWPLFHFKASIILHPSCMYVCMYIFHNYIMYVHTPLFIEQWLRNVRTRLNLLEIQIKTKHRSWHSALFLSKRYVVDLTFTKIWVTTKNVFLLKMMNACTYDYDKVTIHLTWHLHFLNQDAMSWFRDTLPRREWTPLDNQIKLKGWTLPGCLVELYTWRGLKGWRTHLLAIMHAI